MEQRQEYKTQIELIVLRIIIYIARPFQVTKLLELLYAFGWLAFLILSLLPDKYVTGAFFILIQEQNIPKYLVSICLAILVIYSFIGIWQNIIRIRQIVLTINIGILLWVAFFNLIKIPIAGGAVYLVILALLTIIALWRIDVET